MEFALEYKVKQSKNGQFSYHFKPAQSILKRLPQKDSLKNVSPGAGLFSEFYSMDMWTLTEVTKWVGNST